MRRQIRRSVKAGDAQDLATAAARSVGGSARSADADIAEVRVVSSRYAYSAFFAGQRVPEGETVHAVAPVERTSR